MINAALLLFLSLAIPQQPEWIPELLTQTEAELGFFPLFDGLDLDGWHIESDDKNAVSTRDGNLLFSKECRLATINLFENFVLRYEYRVYGECQSAVLVRAATDGDGKAFWEQPCDGLNEADKWHTVEIACQDAKIRVLINQQVQNDAILPVQILGGPIMIAHSSGAVEYRKLRLKPLPGGSGWCKLFNGNSLAGWRSLDKGVWKIENGVLTALSSRKIPRLISDETFQDFHLRLMTRYTGSGGTVIVRSQSRSRDPIRIRIGTHKSWMPGSIGKIAPVGEPRMIEGCWGQVEISTIGPNIRVAINGKIVMDYMCRRRQFYPWGWIMLESVKNGKVEFQDIEIKTISKNPEFRSQNDA